MGEIEILNGKTFINLHGIKREVKKVFRDVYVYENIYTEIKNNKSFTYKNNNAFLIKNGKFISGYLNNSLVFCILLYCVEEFFDRVFKECRKDLSFPKRKVENTILKLM